jgi:hypothetical protein
MDAAHPPLEYLASCSKTALESFELSRLNQAANYRKDVQQILQGWIDTEVDARIARWILDSKQSQADHLDNQRGAIAQPFLPQLDPSFLPPDGACAAHGELQENVSDPDCQERRPRETPVLSSAARRVTRERRKSFGMKRARLRAKPAGEGSLNGSAPALAVPKPPFAQDEENALHELEHFVQQQPAGAQAGLQNIAAGSGSRAPDERPRLARRIADHSRRETTNRHTGVHLFASTEPPPAAACRASLQAISISGLDPAMPTAAAGRWSSPDARLNVRTLTHCCRPGLVRSRGKELRPRAAYLMRLAPAF